MRIENLSTDCDRVSGEFMDAISLQEPPCCCGSSTTKAYPVEWQTCSREVL